MRSAPLSRTGEADAMSRSGRLVRLFALTAGRARPSRDVFALITQVTAVDERTASPNVTLQPEHLRILRVCPTPTAVVEVAARVDLPVSVVTVMLSDLLEAGRITTQPPAHVAPYATTGPDITLLQRVREGLARI
ncbi:uncharacterized protein DUF742 [Streptomyces sp. SLBN-118]|uniref:DUF742 domain-containing protein n=1 Tax=Streptomyces sp. SLBN-118 TaxID=2768454 RepID=UPI0011665885|nr:DUF742 domain-containing protein [Streptomyces sp. SLBN-118]TQK50882.1 uncharacterized protein DUF742 [Streptomyces sp. SLBN-118]